MLKLKNKKIKLIASTVILFGLVGCVKEDYQGRTAKSSCLKSEEVESVARTKAVYTEAIEDKILSKGFVENQEKTVSEFSTTSENEDVALVDARVRTLNNKMFVKELLFVDFSANQTADIPETFTFQGDIFQDNGIGHDEVANDGVYTALTPKKFNAEIPFVPGQIRKSVIDHAVVNVGFQHMADLENYLDENGIHVYNDPASANGPIVTIDCDIHWACGCWGTCCGFVIENCHFTVGWS